MDTLMGLFGLFVMAPEPPLHKFGGRSELWPSAFRRGVTTQSFCEREIGTQESYAALALQRPRPSRRSGRRVPNEHVHGRPADRVARCRGPARSDRARHVRADAR